MRVLSTGANPLWCENYLMNNLGMPVIGPGARSADLAHRESAMRAALTWACLLSG
jgi:hypothetical protein